MSRMHIARALIALVVATFLVAGCGGGDKTRFDWGDAPDKPSPYPTVSASGGACHIMAGTKFLHLGNRIDAEPDGQPNAAATGDNLVNLPDEDGVTFTSAIIAGGTATVTVVASDPGKLDAWIDFNHDGWGTPGDKIFVSVPLVTGPNNLAFLVPANAVNGGTYARFRFSSGGNLPYGGLALDGEVEDYRIGIE